MTRARRPPRTAADWLTLAVCALIVSTLVFFAIVEQRRLDLADGVALEVTFRAEEAARANDQFLVPFTVANTGSTAILSADLIIEVYQETRLVESAPVTVTFLPLKGRQHGLYASERDPRETLIRWRLESLQLP